jgi:hypothetical protein
MKGNQNEEDVIGYCPSLFVLVELLFLMMMLGDFLATMALCIPYVHLPDMAIARDVEPRNAAFLISSAGMCSPIGRVLAGPA